MEPMSLEASGMRRGYTEEVGTNRLVEQQVQSSGSKESQDRTKSPEVWREKQEVNSQRKVEAKGSDTTGLGFRNQKYGEFIQGRKQDRGILRDICDNPGQQ